MPQPPLFCVIEPKETSFLELPRQRRQFILASGFAKFGASPRKTTFSRRATRGIGTCFPADRNFRLVRLGCCSAFRGEGPGIFYQGVNAGRGIEKGLGNLSFTPAVVARLEVAKVCKVLPGIGEPLRQRTRTIDLREMVFVEVVRDEGCSVLPAVARL